MIRSTPGPIEALATRAPVGLIGAITVEVYDRTDGSTVIAPTTQGITELRPGTYSAQLTISELGSYMVRWGTPNGGIAEESLLVVKAGDTRPTMEEVADLLRARTVDDDGDQIGVFTNDGRTRPSASQVDSLIDRAFALQAPALGTPPDELVETARGIVALRAAMLVEASYFPEDVEDGRGSTALLSDQYAQAVKDYAAALNDNVVGSRRSASIKSKTFLARYAETGQL